MVMVLPPGIPTLEAMASKNRTRVDNMYCDERTAALVDLCDTKEEWRPVKTDHFPIITHVRLMVERGAERPRFDYTLVDWEEFNKDLKARLEEIPKPTKIRTQEEANQKLERINRIIEETIEQHVPMTKPCPYSKRWWNEDLTKIRKDVRRLGRRARRVAGAEGHPNIAQYHKRRNEFSEAIRTAKNRHWVNWLENLSSYTIWDAHRLVKAAPSDGGAARVPMLRTRDPITREVVEEVTDNESKARTFYNLFFPGKPLVSAVPADHDYPDPLWIHESVSDDLIQKAIKKLRPKKASKPGSVPNCVLINAGKLLGPHLGPLYRATDEIGWYPDCWRETQTPVIKKLGKSDYSAPGAWRPIVLSDGLARLLNKCKAMYLGEKCEKLGILQNNHFGGRPGRSTVDSIHLLVKMIKDAWRKQQIASVLFLDVKGAFPSVAIDRMVHEMKEAGIP
jgi:hypothetical protein